MQNNANSLNHWCSSNCFPHNTAKAEVMTYSRKSVVVTSFYNFRCAILTCVTEIRDVGIMFNSSLLFHCYINHEIRISLSAPAVACCISKQFFYQQIIFMTFSFDGICQTDSSNIERALKKLLSNIGYRVFCIAGNWE